MNGLPYYKAYPRDFIEGTIGMPFEIKCAYRVVLDLIYMQGGNLPDDARYISGLLGCSIRKWKCIRDFLVEAGKIQVSGDFLTNYRAEKELETLAKLQDKQRENRARPNKNKGLATPKPDQPEPEPEPERKRDTNVSLTRDALESEFSQFWAVVPKKVGRGAAEKAFAKALKKASFAEIIAGMEAYASQRDGQDAQYTCHPATWLNQERWLDEATETQADFHSKINEMLGGGNGISGSDRIDHRQGEPVSQQIQTPVAPGHRGEHDGDQGDSRGNQQPHLSLIKPRRFGGTY